MQQSGTHKPHKTLWTLGNYSSFIRPGYQRISLTGADNIKGLMATAYKSSDETKYVTVFVNMTNAEQKVVLSYNNLQTGKTADNTDIYITDEDFDLKRITTISPNRSFRIPPRSVVTMLMNTNQL